MFKVKVENTRKTEAEEMRKPKDCFGLKKGEVYQQYFNGVAQNEYLVGTGRHDRPIVVWWDDEKGEYRLSSESKKELRQFCSLVRYKKVNAKVNFCLELL